MKNKILLCPHGVPYNNFCCRCHYGSLLRKEHTKEQDAVDDMNMPVGYKLWELGKDERLK